MVEGPARRSAGHLAGRTCTLKKAVFLDAPLAASLGDLRSAGAPAPVRLRPGDYVAVRVEEARAGSSTLMATPLARTSIADFQRVFGGSVVEAAAARLAVRGLERLGPAGAPLADAGWPLPAGDAPAPAAAAAFARG